MKFKEIEEIPQEVLDALGRMGFEEMRDIQERTLLPILEGRDILAQSKTGSGKSVAFGLPLVINAKRGSGGAKSLILAPTRELAQQIAKELRAVSAGLKNFKIVLLYGGVPLRTQADSLAKGADIIIGTPGRVIDHLSRETLRLDTIETIVLDEADKMLNMGFYGDVVKIVKAARRVKQRVLFSATFSQDVERLANELLCEPLTVKVDDGVVKQRIDEYFYRCSDKFAALNTILQSFTPKSVLVFCNRKQDVIALTKRLDDAGNFVTNLHGDLEQFERDEAVIEFANGTRPLLVATDIASRGLDIKDIELVINYDTPQNLETYTHRIGRTGRADASGVAVTLLNRADEAKYSFVLERAKALGSGALKPQKSYRVQSEFDTLCINGGKREKLRAGDILGTLCKEFGIENANIGKIDISAKRSYVELHHKALQKLAKSIKIKKRKFVCWVL